jgi:hypothetical protein
LADADLVKLDGLYRSHRGAIRSSE